MAALDFPNSPTNGQQYSAPNGVIYTYDGVAWTTSGVLSTGSTAGGSLAGTYPNPSIATGAVRGTPSSGGTQREILKASIWGGDDLIDLSVPTAKLAAAAVTVAKLAVGAAVRQIVAANMPTNYTLTGGAAWTDVTTQAITTSGGTVVIFVSAGWWVLAPANTDTYVLTGLALDQVTPNIVAGERHCVTPGTGNLVMPLPALIGVNTPAAGAHTYHVVGYCPAGNSLKTAATWPGTLTLVELA